jgi:anti-sigma factor RsiW
MTEQHVPVERLAAYAAGDLDAAAALDVEAHVLLCADCRADVEAVQRAATALASVESVTMPADVAARIDAALAAETPVTPGVPTAPAGNVLPMVSKKRRPSFAGIAAVAAGVALLGAISVPLLTGGGDKGTPTASGARDATHTRRLESGLTYAENGIDATLTRALRGVTAAPLLADSAGEAAGPSAMPTPASTGVSRTSGKGATSAPAAVVAGAGAPGAAFSLKTLQTDAGRLAACVTALAGTQETAEGKVPLLVDFARYRTTEGVTEAVVVVFPTERKGVLRTDKVDVVVAGPRCGVTAGEDDLLQFARIDRPAGL